MTPKGDCIYLDGPALELPAGSRHKDCHHSVPLFLGGNPVSHFIGHRLWPTHLSEDDAFRLLLGALLSGNITGLIRALLEKFLQESIIDLSIASQ